MKKPIIIDILKNILRYYECEYKDTSYQDEFLEEALKNSYDLMFFDLDYTNLFFKDFMQKLSLFVL